MTDKHFSRKRAIHISHCDPAGIVSFPQCLMLFNKPVETWFSEELAVPGTGMIATRRTGLRFPQDQHDRQKDTGSRAAADCGGKTLRRVVPGSSHGFLPARPMRKSSPCASLLYHPNRFYRTGRLP